MPWIRGGDTSATYPPVMKVAGLPGADDRSVNEVMGFIFRLATQSSAHLTDYIVDVGTVAMFGGARADVLVRQCKKVGLLSEVRADGMKAYKIREDPDFLHLRLKAEIEWQQQQQSDGKNEALTVPIRVRDGDRCRYCGVMVMWRGRTSNRSATFDHLVPGDAGTVATMVVACRGCNSELRDIFGREREHLNPAPVDPFYSDFTADWLTSRGHPVAASERPDSQSDNAQRKARKNNTRQRAGSQPATAPSASDPAAPSDTARTTTTGDGECAFESHSERDREAIGSSSTGPGRDRVGSGDTPLPAGSSRPRPAGTRRRKRSRRGRDPSAATTARDDSQRQPHHIDSAREGASS